VTRIADCAALAERYDLLVVGAGPAGMSAAARAAASGLSVLLADENAEPGGQIYRKITDSPVRDRGVLGDDYWKGEEIVRRFEASGADYAPGATVWHLDATLEAGIAMGAASRILPVRHAVIATGAIERPFPIEGWTLPGVLTVGAAQILLKSAALVPDGRAVLAGSGPLLWLFAWQCIAAGMAPAMMIDTSARGNLLAAAPHLPGFLLSPYVKKGLKLLRAVRARVPVVAAPDGLAIRERSGGLEIEARRGTASRTVAADTVFLHQGVVPNLSLASAAGCEIVWNEAQAAFAPRTDAEGRSSLAGISIAGDGAGIGGAEVAALSGDRLGLRLASELGGEAEATGLDPARLDAALSRYARGRAFLDALYKPARHYRTGAPAAIACRCEEVTCGMVSETARTLAVPGPNQMKAFLRTGMGPCQGRYCGLTVSELIAEARGVPVSEVGHYRLRSPTKPITLGQLASVPHTDEEVRAVYRT
jgi:NADPH-dependent 2,4-dienoyl-CoA reductase/sulfur reductase-like enzyme